MWGRAVRSCYFTALEGAENEKGPSQSGRNSGGGVGRGESEGPSQKGRCGDVNALAG